MRKLSTIVIVIMVAAFGFSAGLWQARESKGRKSIEDFKQPVREWLRDVPVAVPDVDAQDLERRWKKWAVRGKSIPCIERILQDMYVNYTGEVSLSDVFFGLQYVGTFRSVPLLVEALEDDDLREDQRMEAALALGSIGDPSAVPSMCRVFAKLRYHKDRTLLLKLNMVNALVAIGDPRAIPYVEQELTKVGLGAYYRRTLEKDLVTLKSRKEDFVISWILRWNPGDMNQHPGNLPPYASRGKWIKAGHDILGVEDILIGLYEKRDERVKLATMLEAMGQLGSNQSLPVLSKVIFEGKGLDSEERVKALYAIGDIGTDEAFALLKKIVSAEIPDDFGFENMLKPIAKGIIAEYGNR